MLSRLSWETPSWAHWSCISVSVMPLHQTRGLLQVPCAQPFTRLPEQGFPEHYRRIALTLLNSTKAKPHWFNGARILLVCLVTLFSQLSITYWAYRSHVSFRQPVDKEAAPHGMVYHYCLRDGLNLPEENHDSSLFNTQLPPCAIQARPIVLLAEQTSRRVADPRWQGQNKKGGSHMRWWPEGLVAHVAAQRPHGQVCIIVQTLEKCSSEP